jgi:hypothetical protein
MTTDARVMIRTRRTLIPVHDPHGSDNVAMLREKGNGFASAATGQPRLARSRTAYSLTRITSRTAQGTNASPATCR